MRVDITPSHAEYVNKKHVTMNDPLRGSLMTQSRVNRIWLLNLQEERFNLARKVRGLTDRTPTPLQTDVVSQ